MKKYITTSLFFVLFICQFHSVNAQTDDTLRVIMKLRVVNAIFTYNNSSAANGEIDLLWAVRIDTDDNNVTGLNGYDLELSLSHLKESGGSLLGNILQSTQYAAWKLTSTGRTKITAISAEVNLEDTTLIIKALKTITEISKVKEGNRFMAISLINGSSGLKADSTIYGIIPAVVSDPRSDCSSSVNDILTVQVLNAAKGTSVLQSNDPAYSVNIYPQPMQSHSRLQIDGKISKPMTILIVNAHGQRVRVLNNIHQSTIILERNDLQAGIYFYQLVSENDVIGNGRLIIAE
jgi:hypothetical protein